MTIVHHTGLCPADFDAALRFYREGIGLDILVDSVMAMDLEPLLGIRTASVRTVFLGDADRPDGGIVELIDVGSSDITDAPTQSGVPSRGLFLLSLQVDIQAVLARLAALGLGQPWRTMTRPDGSLLAATVVDPDGVIVELLHAGRAVLGSAGPSPGQ
jgi:catechol 2,3-dioxygenase-like lactoylglutathione lyase family enzyme